MSLNVLYKLHSIKFSTLEQINLRDYHNDSKIMHTIVFPYIYNYYRITDYINYTIMFNNIIGINNMLDFIDKYKIPVTWDILEIEFLQYSMDTDNDWIKKIYIELLKRTLNLKLEYSNSYKVFNSSMKNTNILIKHEYQFYKACKYFFGKSSYQTVIAKRLYHPFYKKYFFQEMSYNSYLKDSNGLSIHTLKFLDNLFPYHKMLKILIKYRVNIYTFIPILYNSITGISIVYNTIVPIIVTPIIFGHFDVAYSIIKYYGINICGVPGILDYHLYITSDNKPVDYQEHKKNVKNLLKKLGQEKINITDMKSD